MPWRVKHWGENFENNKSRERDRCSFVCVPNKHDGLGLAVFLAEKDGHALYGIYQLLLQKLSRQKKPRGGWLTLDGHSTGTPWTPNDLAAAFHCPVEMIERCLALACSERVGWMEFTTATTHAGHSPGTATTHAGHSPGTATTHAGHEAPAECLGKKEGKKEEREDGCAREGAFPEVNCPPSLAEVTAYGASHGYTLELCQEFFRYWSGACWVLNEHTGRRMGDFRPFLDQRAIDQAKKKAAIPKGGGGGGVFELKTKAENLKELVATHPANPDSASYREDCTVEDRKNLTGLRQELEKVRQQLAGRAA